MISDDEVRELFVYGAWERALNGCDDEENGKVFDAWLLKLKADIWEECAKAQDFYDPTYVPTNPYSKKRKTLKRKAKKTSKPCPPDCECLCHEGLGDVEHPGERCYGKST